MTAKARAKRLAKWQAAAAVIGVSAFFLIGLQQVTAPRSWGANQGVSDHAVDARSVADLYAGRRNTA